MQRTWRRAWLRGKPHYMRYKPVRKAHAGSIKDKVYDLTVKAAKKLAPAAAAAGIFLSSLAGVQANPTGGSITAGTGSITGQGTNHVTINQTSDKLAVNWNSFSIGSGEKVQFIQPGASSIALNRVLGNNASAIYGQLSANGKVFLLNPNGVLFAQGAQVNVGGLVASTLNLSDQDFMNGKYSFSGDSQQGVLNQGNITAANGGYAVLLGANAANEGVILAKEGTVALGAGSKIALDFIGDGLLTLSVDESKVKAEVKNSGLIKADGGLVVMNAKAADTLTGSVVNNTGTIEARSVTSKNGTIILTGNSVTNAGTLDASGKHAGETGGTVRVLGDTVRLAAGAAIDVSGDQGGGTALVGGAYQGGASEYAATKTVVEQGTSINADALTDGNGGQVVVWANDTTSFAGGISAKGGKNSGDGGSVETSGKKTLTVVDTASVNTTAANGKTGNWLLDPADFVVDDTGAKGMTAAALSAALEISGVTITTTADTASSTSGAANTDTSGNGDITINSAVNWSAGGNVLTLNAHRNININANVTASGAGAGLALSHGTDGAYSLGSGAKITLSGANASFSLNGSNYSVINSHSTDGALKALQNIENDLAGNYFLGEDIDASATAAWNPKSGSGYFGFDPIGDYNKNFTGRFDGGGHTISGLTINRGVDNVGLFARTGTSSDIRNVGLVGGSVSGSGHVGGLVGTGYGSITNSYNSGSVSGSSSFVGGLVGYQQSGSIMNSYNSGSVSGSSNVGGLIGNAYISSITNSYNSGSVSGSGGSIGGLAGSNSSSITNSYNSGSVSGSSSVGGLVGYGFDSGSITNSYNSGSVIGSSKVGGFAGYNDGTIKNSYNSGSVTGDDQVGGLVGYGSNSGRITNSYNSGSVIGSSKVGGLVGYQYSGSVKNSYNSGSVTGDDQVGGLVGYREYGSVTDSFYATTNASGGSINNGGTKDSVWSGNANGTGKDLATLQSASFWTTGDGKAWSTDMDTVGGADTIWRIYDGHTTPLLKSFLTKTTVNADNKSKTYDGTVYSAAPTNVTYAPGTVLDLLLGRENPTYGNARNAGTYGFLYSGQHGYDIVYETGLLTINKADLTVNLTGTVSKIYDRYTSANVTSSNYSLSGLISGDNVTVYRGTATYDTKNVGENKAVTVTGLNLGGEHAGNYNLTSTTATANIGEITPKELTPYLTGSVTKTYDGNNSAPLAASNYYLWGLVSGDTATVSGTATYNNKNAGTGKTVTASDLTLRGADAANYSLTSSTATTNNGTIYQKALSAEQTEAVTKVYNKTNEAVFNNDNLVLEGVIAGDTVGVSGTGSYDSVNVGDRTVTVTRVTLDNANYKLDVASITGSGSEAGELTGKIDKAALTITAKENTKTYDGTTTAAATPEYTGLQIGDILTNLIAVYEDKNAGSGKTLKVSGYTLTDGNNGGNYTVTLVDATGSINQRQLTAVATAQNKVYDGNKSATVTEVAFGNLVEGESLTASYTGGTYETKDAGSSIKVTVNGIGMAAGADTLTANYLLPTEVTTTAAITPRQLTATAAAQNKVYDGNSSATVTGVTFGNLVEGDSLTANYTGGTYETKDAGSGIKVTVNGVSMTAGADTLTANYLLTTEVTTTAAITPRQLTAAVTAQNKVYDGTTNATISSVTFGNLAAGETLTAGYTGGAFNDKHVGDNKTITVSGLTMTAGADTLAGNYLLPVSVASNAAITPAALTITAAANTKTYDGTTTAAATPTYSGLQEGDSLTGLAEVYTDKNVGEGKTLQVSGGYTLNDGNNGGNYAVTLVEAAGTIDKRQLTATATAQNKVYDGKTDAAVDSVIFGNLVAGETLTADYTGGKFSDKNAGDNKTVTVSGLTMTAGANTLADNYLLPANVTAHASITPAALTITAAANTKTYDGTTTADVTPTYSGLQEGDSLTGLVEVYTDKNVGEGKTLRVSAYTLNDGNNGGNYTVSLVDNEAGTIKPAAITITHPGYIAAVQNRQQSAVNNTSGAGENHAYPPANAAPPQLSAGQASPIQYSSNTAGTPRVITTAGETVTIVQDSLLQLATNPIQKEIAVYQAINGSSALAGVYQVDGSQGSLTLRKRDTSFTPVMPESAAAQAETATFQLTDSRGNTANFTIAYTGGSLYIQGANATAADMLNQNQQLITATSLVAVQDKLGLDINNLQAVYLVK